MSKLITKQCPSCKTEFKTYPSIDAKCCSKKCSAEHVKATGQFKGTNNHNSGKKWTEEQKSSLSATKTAQVADNPQLRSECGKSNRGVKFTQARIDSMHAHRTPESYSKPHTEDTKRKIGTKSREKFTDDYRENYRTKMELGGHWVQRDQKADFEIYYSAANWNQRLWDVVESELTNTLGVFHPTKNSKGVVRDHMYSRKSGFENGVFPSILRHPANCQIITHSANVKKRVSRYIDKNALTLDEVFNRITTYKHSWHEQETCLLDIKRYLNGERWTNEHRS